MRGEGQVDVVAVRIVEAGADDGSFQIVMLMCPPSICGGGGIDSVKPAAGPFSTAT
jgi:hypothetical protein